MSSSTRAATPCEAAIYRKDRPVGPVRLPRTGKSLFIEEFNRLYDSTGISIEGTDINAEQQETAADSP